MKNLSKSKKKKEKEKGRHSPYILPKRPTNESNESNESFESNKSGWCPSLRYEKSPPPERRIRVKSRRLSVRSGEAVFHMVAALVKNRTEQSVGLALQHFGDFLIGFLAECRLVLSLERQECGIIFLQQHMAL